MPLVLLLIIIIRIDTNTNLFIPTKKANINQTHD